MTEKWTQAYVFFDGVCNFCNNSVNFIIERDPQGYFKFAPLQSEAAAKYINQYEIDTAKLDSVILVEEGKVYTHSTAALRIARHLSGWWRWLYVFRLVPAPIRDFLYKQFAKYRYVLFGKQEACMLPTPEVRSRFLATN